MDSRRRMLRSGRLRKLANNAETTFLEEFLHHTRLQSSPSVVAFMFPNSRSSPWSSTTADLLDLRCSFGFMVSLAGRWAKQKVYENNQLWTENSSICVLVFFFCRFRRMQESDTCHSIQWFIFSAPVHNGFDGWRWTNSPASVRHGGSDCRLDVFVGLSCQFCLQSLLGGTCQWGILRKQ